MTFSAASGAVGVQHAIAEVPEGFDRQRQHPRFVLDHKDGRRGASGRDRRRARDCSRRVGVLAEVSRQIDLERRSATRLGVDLDVPAGLLDETEDLAEPETRSLGSALGGEERFEGLRRDLRGHSRACIGDGDKHVLALLGADVVRRVDGVEMSVRRFYRQLAALGHGVAAIHRQIEDRALELARIGIGAPEAACEHGLEADLVAEGASEQLGHAGDDLVAVDRLRHQRLLTREGEQAVRQPPPRVPRRRARCRRISENSCRRAPPDVSGGSGCRSPPTACC